jgi:hypothetical protein
MLALHSLNAIIAPCRFHPMRHWAGFGSAPGFSRNRQGRAPARPKVSFEIRRFDIAQITRTSRSSSLPRINPDFARIGVDGKGHHFAVGLLQAHILARSIFFAFKFDVKAAPPYLPASLRDF